MSFGARLNQRVRVQFFLSVLAIVMPQWVSAQTISTPVPCSDSLNLRQLALDTFIAEHGIVTANTISPTHLTTPSFWWIKEQLNTDKEFGNKFIDKWFAYRDKNRVDLVVNRQLWSILDYIGRYSFISKFGATARDYQYDVRIINDQGTPLALYTCNYTTTPAKCEIQRCEAFGQDSLGIPRPPLSGE